MRMDGTGYQRNFERGTMETIRQQMVRQSRTNEREAEDRFIDDVLTFIRESN